jgi:8-oxo-dGTP diphosphatase
VIETRVAAYGVIIDDGRILLSHWTEGRRWSLPGGGLELGEQPAAGAIREIREETGYDAELGRILGVDTFLVSAEQRLHGTGPLQGVRIVYEARVVGGVLTDELDGSSDEARWFPLEQLDSIPTVDLVGTALGWAAAQS